MRLITADSLHSHPGGVGSSLGRSSSIWSYVCLTTDCTVSLGDIHQTWLKAGRPKDGKHA